MSDPVTRTPEEPDIPTTEEIREWFATDDSCCGLGDVDSGSLATFDRWLAAHDAEVRNATQTAAAAIARGYTLAHPTPFTDEIGWQNAVDVIAEAIEQNREKEGSQ